MNNYEFCADWVQKYADDRPIRVLDYGCGSGQIVGLLRERGIDAWGCDVFYEGGNRSSQIPTVLQPYIQRMQGSVIPHSDISFDVVLSNQVFEHVPDMEATLIEIARILKPDGVAFNIFPDRGVWREGHCGIPFLHWFPKNTNARIYYAALLRCIGFGYFTEGRTVMDCARGYCTWLDRWTYYRSLAEIRTHFNRFIGQTRHAEEDQLSARFSGRFNGLPKRFQRLIVRKMAGLVLISIKKMP
jgi:SAM-dependent methyltransferase